MTDLTEIAAELTRALGLSGTGFAETGLPGVKLLVKDSPVERGPLMYSSGIFFVISGRKQVYLGTRAFDYDGETYLAVGLPLVMECETIASPQQPLTALYVAVDPLVLRSVASAIDLDIGQKDAADVAVSAAPFAGEMRAAVARLMRILCSAEDTAVLGEAAVREIIFRTLQGPAAAALCGLLTHDGHTSRISRVMEALHANFANRISVDEMAGLAGMSASAFHRAFRQVAGDTPLQYLKKLRLTRASALIAHQDYRIGVAASSVGYESAAQFSRDFKSHFGVSPADARKLGYAFIRDGMNGGMT